jgi:hypothetical protein
MREVVEWTNTCVHENVRRAKIKLGRPVLILRMDPRILKGSGRL